MFNLLKLFRGLRDKRKENIWQLFHATDFESLMYPCFTFCRILGIFPYKINAAIFKTCKLRYIFSTIIMCIFCILELTTLYTTNISKGVTLKNVGTPRILERNFFYILSGLIIVTTFTLSGPRMRLLQTILEVSLKLPPELYQNLSKLIHTKDILGFLFITIIMPIYFSILQFDAMRKLFIVYVLLLVFQMDMLYMNCVCILKACFKQINDNLINLRKLVTNGELYLLSSIDHEQRNSLLLMEIIALKKQHLAISNTVQMLKMVFSLQLLFTIVMTFIEITFNLYYYLLQIQMDVSMSSQEKQTYYESFVTSVIYHLIKLVLIIWACETAKNQAMEIGSTIHDVFNSSNNEEIKYELELFSLQLLHCENVFSAKGLTVDATLLTMITGGITTYLLILIQFLITSNSCNGIDLQSSLLI